MEQEAMETVLNMGNEEDSTVESGLWTTNIMKESGVEDTFRDDFEEDKKFDFYQPNVLQL